MVVQFENFVFIIPDSIPIETLKQKIKSIEDNIKKSIDDFDVIEGEINVNIHNIPNRENNICFEFVTREKPRRSFTNNEVLDKFQQMMIDKLTNLGITQKRVERWKNGVDVNR